MIYKNLKVREYQGKEGNHFLEVFNKKAPIIIKREGCSLPHLFHIQHKGTKSEHTSAIQLELAESSRLSSNSTYVVETEVDVTVWFGKGTVNEERDFGVRVAKSLANQKTIIFIEEGQETSSFWESLGGKLPYASAAYLQSKSHPIVPRL